MGQLSYSERIRDWWRGYSHADVESAVAKLTLIYSMAPGPRPVLTEAERLAARTLPTEFVDGSAWVRSNSAHGAP